MLDDKLLSFHPHKTSFLSPSTFTYNLDSSAISSETELLPNPPLFVPGLDVTVGDIVTVRYLDGKVEVLKLFGDIQPDNRYQSTYLNLNLDI